MKKIILWAVILFVGFEIITNPHGAAALFSAPFHLLEDAGNNAATFLKSL